MGGISCSVKVLRVGRFFPSIIDLVASVETLGHHWSTLAKKLPVQCDCKDLCDRDSISDSSFLDFWNPERHRRSHFPQLIKGPLYLSNVGNTKLHQVIYFLDDAFAYILADHSCCSKRMVQVNGTKRNLHIKSCGEIHFHFDCRFFLQLFEDSSFGCEDVHCGTLFNFNTIVDKNLDATYLDFRWTI